MLFSDLDFFLLVMNEFKIFKCDQVDINHFIIYKIWCLRNYDRCGNIKAVHTEKKLFHLLQRLTSKIYYLLIIEAKS